MADGPFMKVAGKKSVSCTDGRMSDGTNLTKLLKNVSPTNFCYVCRDVLDFSDIDSMMYVGLGIRKVGKRYKRRAFHLSCDQSQTEE